jgi:hypothetical protein
MILLCFAVTFISIFMQKDKSLTVAKDIHINLQIRLDLCSITFFFSIAARMKTHHKISPHGNTLRNVGDHKYVTTLKLLSYKNADNRNRT